MSQIIKRDSASRQQAFYCRPWARRIRNALLVSVSSMAILHGGLVYAATVDDARGSHALLFDQAKYWKEKGRGDLAIGTLKRLLQSDPNNALGLYETAKTYVDQGDLTSARTYEKRLNQVAPQSKLAERLRTEMENAKLDTDLIDRARTAAQSDDTEKAVALYEQLFKGRLVAGSLAVEYYHTLSGVDGRWEEARAHLAEIVAQQPDNFEAAIAYIDVLSYREETRRTAIEKYLQLSETGLGGEIALDHLRNSLLWMGATA